MATKNYLQALEEAFTFWDYTYDHSGNVVEELLSIGYRAGLTDGVRAVKDTAGSVPSNDPSARFYAVAIDKLASVARKFEERIKKNGVQANVAKSEGWIS